ncbi:hypothetical protein MUCCIDRAFT_82429 [Mucor lusitanicus CBS 277.49]|uniref:Uncharacterized protein n=1 Tax=Mucor lusitanicus CBS 277.49 TaxID=747725 RepID=A0A168K6G4_MUCCL|nr:hypothetical protein MUCCIDRAFT_82429 [Mucor lusitanicus CBS 277.49]
MGKNVIDWLLIIIIIESNKVGSTNINDAASNSAVNQLLLVFWHRKSTDKIDRGKRVSSPMDRSGLVPAKHTYPFSILTSYNGLNCDASILLMGGYASRFGVGLAIIIMCKFYFMQKSGATLDEAQTIIVFPLLQDVQVERMISQGRAIPTMLE